MNSETPPQSERIKRLVYRANHRGMRELDVTFGAWVSELAASGGLNGGLSEGKLSALERLLERTEPDLLALLCESALAQTDEELALMQELRQFLRSSAGMLKKNPASN